MNAESNSSRSGRSTPASWPADLVFHLWRMRFVRGFVALVIIAAVFLIGRCTVDTDRGTVGAMNAGEAGPAGQSPTVWTCSMHPQIRANKPGQCPICFMDLVPVTSDDADADAARLTLSGRAKTLAQVQTTEVRMRDLTNEIQMVGKVAPDETRITYISSYIPGRIDRLFVDYTGIMVREGDHLAELYSPELLVAQREYLLARQAVTQSEASNTSNALAQSAARTVLEAARRKLELWGIPKDEIERLNTESAASDHMRIDAPTSGWVLERQGYQGMYVDTGTRLFTVVDLTRVWVLLDAYESDVQYLRYGQPVEFESESFAGDRLTGKIAYIDPVLNEATRTVKIRVNVPNPSLKLRPGMFVSAHVHAKLGKDGKVMTSELAGRYICPMHPEVIRDEPGKCSECGMDLVTTESLGYASKSTPPGKAHAIPASSVLLTGRRAVVYVETSPPSSDGGATYEGRVVELGPRAGDWYAVLSGVRAGERVATRGAIQIDSAMQIQARPSMMQPPAASDQATLPEAHTTDVSSHPVASRDSDSQVKSRHAADAESGPKAGAPYHAHVRPMIDAYLRLTKSLAADDAEAAVKAVAGIHQAAQHALMMASQIGLNESDAATFKESIGKIAAASKLGDTPAIEQIRKQLPKINEPFEQYLQTFGHNLASPIRRAYCPMAFDNAGGYWFQAGDTIENAYFGSKMLRCGVIKGEIDQDGKAAN